MSELAERSVSSGDGMKADGREIRSGGDDPGKLHVVTDSLPGWDRPGLRMEMVEMAERAVYALQGSGNSRRTDTGEEANP